MGNSSCKLVGKWVKFNLMWKVYFKFDRMSRENWQIQVLPQDFPQDLTTFKKLSNLNLNLPPKI